MIEKIAEPRLTPGTKVYFPRKCLQTIEVPGVSGSKQRHFHVDNGIVLTVDKIGRVIIENTDDDGFPYMFNRRIVDVFTETEIESWVSENPGKWVRGFHDN